MIVTNKFLFIHLPKTGGTFVTKTLKEVGEIHPALGVREIGENEISLRKITQKIREIFPFLNIKKKVNLKHAGMRYIPHKYSSLPVVINVRNVFEHYVSRYEFKWWAEPKWFNDYYKIDMVKKIYPNFPNLTFSEYVHFVNNWRLRKGKPLTLLGRNNIGSNTWNFIRLTQRQPILFVRRYLGMSLDEVKDEYAKFRFLRTESLNDDLYNLLVESGVPGEKIDFILDQKPILPKRGGRGVGKETWREYFSDDDIAFVMQREAMLFKIFPYMIPGE